MDIELSWNLVIGAFFVLILAYSFIVGSNQTAKIIIGTYIAAFAAEALSNYFHKYFLLYSPLVRTLSDTVIGQYFLYLKIILFVLMIVIFVVRADFEAMFDVFDSLIIRTILTVVFGVLSAGLIVSVMLMFISGNSFIGTLPSSPTTDIIRELSADSRLVRIMIQNYNLWFALPALLIIFISFVGGREKTA